MGNFHPPLTIPKISGVKATELMPRFEGAWGRFNERQDDRGEAEAVASGQQKGKAYAQQVYQGRRRSSMERRKEKAQKPGLEKPETDVSVPPERLESSTCGRDPRGAERAQKGGKSGMNLHVNRHVPEYSHPHTLERQEVMRVLTVGPDGFEPSPPVPKTGVLPLDDGPKELSV